MVKETNSQIIEIQWDSMLKLTKKYMRYSLSPDGQHVEINEKNMKHSLSMELVGEGMN